ncbi:MAG: carboxylesterase family protein [Deltaproteobacteria bacterium]|nr:carboxylesterase family protein [Deltaproteobacteria bacterium]
MLRRLSITLVLLGALAACGGGTSTPLTASDASEPAPDAGLREEDAGEAADVGVPEPDAGEVADAGAPEDAGIPDDAGEVADAGTPAEPVDFTAWFASYNADQTLDYLNLPITGAGPDPRYAAAPAHVFHPEVAYGPHPRNVLDVWSQGSAAPAVVFIHGGGFQSGSKEDIHNNVQTIPRYLAAGFTVVSISYRYTYRDPDAAVNATNPDDVGSVHDVNGARLDYVLRDCARAIQFIRYRAAELNVDPTRIGAYGGSAGAGCATWTGTVPDLAVPGHPDPVLRQSSRLQAVGHTNGQPTYNWPRWPDLLRMDPVFVFDNVEHEAVRLTQTPLDALIDTADGQQLSAVMDYYEQMGPGDPPFLTINLLPDLSEAQITDPSQVIHHPRAHVALFERCQAAGLECSIRTQDRTAGPDREMLGFMTRVLMP